MRSMSPAWNVIDEEWLIRCDGIDAVHVFDGIIGHRRRQIPARMTDVGINIGGVAEQIRLPLIRIAPDKAVKVFKAHAVRPLIKWTSLASLECRRIVIFAEP